MEMKISEIVEKRQELAQELLSLDNITYIEEETIKSRLNELEHNLRLELMEQKRIKREKISSQIELLDDIINKKTNELVAPYKEVY